MLITKQYNYIVINDPKTEAAALLNEGENFSSGSPSSNNWKDTI